MRPPKAPAAMMSRLFRRSFDDDTKQEHKEKQQSPHTSSALHAPPAFSCVHARQAHKIDLPVFSESSCKEELKKAPMCSVGSEGGGGQALMHPPSRPLWAHTCAMAPRLMICG